MNPKTLIQLGNILSPVFLLIAPLLWLGVNYFWFLYTSFLWLTIYTWFFAASWYAVVFVMMIRPLADLFPSHKLFRKLCLLRRAFGILSATIILTILFSNWFTLTGSFYGFFSWSSWSFGSSLIARMSEVTAIILLITSNNFSQRLLKKNWKRIQRLSYIYFLSWGILAMRYGDEYFVMITLVATLILFLLAEGKKLWKKFQTSRIRG